MPDVLPGLARLLAAYAIDALGSGLWFPFALIFFTRGQGLSLTAAGFAMSVGSLLGLVVGLMSGGVIDRLGPHRPIVAGTFVRAAVFAVFPWVHSWWLMALGVFLVFASDRVFWSANVPFLRTLTGGRRLDKILGTTVTLQMIGLGVGAALAGLFAGSVPGLHLLAWGNAISFAVAGLLLLSVRGVSPAEVEEAGTVRGPVWRDTAYLQLCLTQVVFVLAASSFAVILPLVALEVSCMGRPGCPECR